MIARVRSRGTYGYSLIEVVIAAMVLAVGVVAVFNVLTAVAGHRVKTGALSAATVLAQQKMEQQRGLDYDALHAATEEFGTIAGQPGFRRVTTVTTGPGGKFKTIKVAVSSRRGGHTVELETLLRRR